MSLISIKYLGDPVNNITRYSCAEFECNLDDPSSCLRHVEPIKAAQLLQDFPGRWEVVDLSAKEIKKMVQTVEYQNRQIAQAGANKEILVYYPGGKIDRVPADSTITISGNKTTEVKQTQPVPDKDTAKAEEPQESTEDSEPEKPKTAEKKDTGKSTLGGRHQCEAEGCGAFTKKDHEFCSKHSKKENTSDETNSV